MRRLLIFIVLLGFVAASAGAQELPAFFYPVIDGDTIVVNSVGNKLVFLNQLAGDTLGILDANGFHAFSAHADSLLRTDHWLDSALAAISESDPVWTAASGNYLLRAAADSAMRKDIDQILQDSLGGDVLAGSGYDIAVSDNSHNHSGSTITNHSLTAADIDSTDDFTFNDAFKYSAAVADSAYGYDHQRQCGGAK